jgi:HSP20 family molecular chaperone IbpA
MKETRGNAPGTILAVQGGPGFPTTDYAADYRGTFIGTAWGDHLIQRYVPAVRGASFASKPWNVIGGDFYSETEYRVELEVPGYQKPEINIEFGGDGKSLTITGKSEKSFEQGPDDEQSSKPHGVTVEEVPEESNQASAKKSTGKEQSTAVTETNKNKDVGAPAAPKYWLSERSVGSFSRTFSFRAALDPEKATASLEHGILTVVIPKATKHAAKKISIA